MTTPQAELYQWTSDAFASIRTDADAEALVSTLTDAFAEMTRPASPEDAETCRLAMLAALQSPETVATTLVWRARALSRAVVVGWTECVAAIAMGEAFSLLATANDQFVRGRTLDVLQPAPLALSALMELEVYLQATDSGIRLGPSSPSRALIRRFLYEKRGFLLLVAGEFNRARESYEDAAREAEGQPRGEVKVALGAALVEYLAGSAVGAEPTRALLERARAGCWNDLVAAAEHNVVAMEKGRSDVLGYEIL